MPSSSTSYQLRMTQPRPWPRWWQVCGLFAAWTLFSVFVFSKFSTLGDSASYLSGYYVEEDNRALRTIVITRIATAVFSLAGSELLAQLAFSMVAAAGVVYMLRQAELRGRYRWPLLMILLVPNFGIWASVAGRESLFIALLGFFLGAVLAYYRRPRLVSMLLASACVAGMIFIRAPYGFGFALFLAMFLLYRSGPATRASAGVQVLVLTMVSIVVLACVWQYLDAYITDDVLPTAQSYFTLRSDTTRTWISIRDAGDLFASLWWSLPLALIGPTPMEAFDRPMVLPFLLSGLVVFACLLHSLALAFRAPPGMLRKILVVGWLPALAFILVSYVPFGIYNPGSAIRYASSFLLFVVFPSLLMSAATSRPAATDARDTSRTDPPAVRRQVAPAGVR